jgi:primase-polymerase (primpol)-like protein
VLVRAELPSGGNRKLRVEMYKRGRFFTMTGRRLRGASHVVDLDDVQVLRRATSAANRPRFAAFGGRPLGIRF